MHYFCTSFIRAGCRTLYVIHWSSGREGHNNYRRDLVIWLVHLIYTVRLAKVALCYNYVILNYCIRFAVLPCVRLSLNSCYIFTDICSFVYVYFSIFPMHTHTLIYTLIHRTISDYGGHNHLTDWAEKFNYKHNLFTNNMYICTCKLMKTWMHNYQVYNYQVVVFCGVCAYLFHDELRGSHPDCDSLLLHAPQDL